MQFVYEIGLPIIVVGIVKHFKTKNIVVGLKSLILNHKEPEEGTMKSMFWYLVFKIKSSIPWPTKSNLSST